LKDFFFEGHTYIHRSSLIDIDSFLCPVTVLREVAQEIIVPPDEKGTFGIGVYYSSPPEAVDA
jgi:hypothetical protein